MRSESCDSYAGRKVRHPGSIPRGFVGVNDITGVNMLRNVRNSLDGFHSMHHLISWTMLIMRLNSSCKTWGTRL